MNCRFKASIVGCGSVGATTAYSYLLSGTVTDMALVDRNKGKATGLKLDLEHSTAFTPNLNIQAGDDYDACAGSNIVVITAGARQKEGETRLDLIAKNREIFAEMIPKITAAAPNAIFIIVSNPVDILTHETIKISGLPANRVIGSGTLLDSARLQFHISQKINIHPSSIDAYILGEHGDSSFPVYSFANVLGKPLTEFEEFSDEVAKECYEETKNAAYRIINDMGYTCYSIATAIRELTDSIFANSKKVFPVSTLLQDYYGHSDVCLSMPCVIGQAGIEKAIDIPLNEEEQKLLAKSVSTLKSYSK
jgi:L-lactate dehydrogenase